MLIALLAFASYRVTRFLIFDTLIEQQRVWVLAKVWGDEPGVVRAKVHELLTCPKCLSVWVGAITVSLTTIWVSVPLPVLSWLAICGAVLVLWRLVED